MAIIQMSKEPVTVASERHALSQTVKSMRGPELDPTVDFVAGTIAGIVGLAVGFPLDTVKVRLQRPETASGYKQKMIYTAITKIVREEKLRGLYKGITSPMAGCAFLNGLVFSSYGLFVRLQLRGHSDQPSIAQIGLAGAGSGMIAALITCPTELIKIRQQIIVNSQPSSKAIVLKLIKANGLRGLFRGITATALRDCGYGTYFMSYEVVCRMLHSSAIPPHTLRGSEVNVDPDQLSWPRLMFAGGLAGTVGWLTTFCFDVVKTRVQASEMTPGNPYRTTRSTMVHMYKTEGLRAFFAGLSPTLIRAFPVNVATFGTFELIIKTLH